MKRPASTVTHTVPISKKSKFPFSLHPDCIIPGRRQENPGGALVLCCSAGPAGRWLHPAFYTYKPYRPCRITAGSVSFTPRPAKVTEFFDHGIIILPPVREQAAGTVLDAFRSPRISSAAVTHEIQRAKAEKAVEIVRIGPFVTGEELTLPVAEKGIVLSHGAVPRMSSPGSRILPEKEIRRAGSLRSRPAPAILLPYARRGRWISGNWKASSGAGKKQPARP